MYFLVSFPYRISWMQGHLLFKNHFYRFHYTGNVLVSFAKCGVWKPAFYPSPWSCAYLELSAILPKVLTEPYHGPKFCVFCRERSKIRDKWVPVTTAWRVLRLRMEERPPIWRVAANILNKQSRTADEVWSSSLGVGRGANNASPWKTFVKKYPQGEMLPLETKQSGGKLLPHSDLRGGEGGGVSRGGITQQEKGHYIGYVEC